MYIWLWIRSAISKLIALMISGSKFDNMWKHIHNLFAFNQILIQENRFSNLTEQKTKYSFGDDHQRTILTYNLIINIILIMKVCKTRIFRFCRCYDWSFRDNDPFFPSNLRSSGSGDIHYKINPAEILPHPNYSAECSEHLYPTQHPSEEDETRLLDFLPHFIYLGADINYHPNHSYPDHQQTVAAAEWSKWLTLSSTY